MATPFMTNPFQQSPTSDHRHIHPQNMHHFQQQQQQQQSPQQHSPHAPRSASGQAIPFPHDFNRHPSNSGSDGSDGSGRGGSGRRAAFENQDDRSDGSDGGGSADEVVGPVGGAYGMEDEGMKLNDDGSVPGGGSAVLAQTFYDPFRIKHRRRTSAPQLKVLEHHFDRNPKPDVNLRKSLAETLGMTPREVQVWFQNRRAKVKKLREKIDKDGPGLDPVDESLPNFPPFSQMPPRGGPRDFMASARRGSSPAILGSSPTMGYDAYFENGGQIVYGNSGGPPLPPLPDRNQPYYHPQPSSSGRRSSQPQLSLPVLQSNVPTSNGNYSQSPTSHSPDFRHLTSGAPPSAYREDQGNHLGRRFSLPAFSSNYPSAISQWPQGPTAGGKEADQYLPPDAHQPQQQQHQPFISIAPQYTSNLYPSPLEVSTDIDPRTVDYGSYSSILRDHSEVAPDYSPGSSGEEDAPYPDYSMSLPPSMISGGTAFEPSQAFSQYSFGAKPRVEHDDSVSPFDYTSSSTGATSPSAGESFFGSAAAGARRSSCPAGFLPQFDNLGIANSPASPASSGAPIWNPMYASSSSNQSLSPQQHHPVPISMQARHSFAAPSPGQYPYGLSPNNQSPYGLAPSPNLTPTNPSPQQQQPSQPFAFPPGAHLLQANDRRGSISNLDTIAEQPLGGGQAFVDLASSEQSMLQSPGSDRMATRKARSQVNLRGPYPPPQRDSRSPNTVGAAVQNVGNRERRGSAPSLDFPLQQPEY